MYTVLIPKVRSNHDAVDWAKENCPSFLAVNTRVIHSTQEYVFLFKFEKEDDAFMFTLRWA